MKAYTVLNIFLLWTSTLIMLIYANNEKVEEQQMKHIQEASDFDIIQNFREPKKIAFSALMGGSSHVHWVISIINELSARGHNTTFITMEDHTKFTKNYPNINTVTIGGSYMDHNDKAMENMRSLSSFELALKFITLTLGRFKKDYLSILDLIKEEQYDLMICDTFNSPCIEAAYKLNMPFILTSSFPQGPDSVTSYTNNNIMNVNEATTQFMGFWDRLFVRFIQPLKLMWGLRHHFQAVNQIYRSLDLEPTTNPHAKWKNSVKMYNTAFGIQQGRPIGPLVEFVGPIIKAKMPALNDELAFYFAHHHKVAYIAFGQHAVMSEDDVKLIMAGLLEAYEAEEIDGIIWATRGLEEKFVGSMVSQSNTTYDIKSFFNHDYQSDILFLDWVPQMAILNNPSTSMFITHGGSASIYESLYSGKRLVIFPFFGDQPSAGATAEKNGIGLKLDYRKPQHVATEIIRTVARDEGNRFQKNVNKFKALIQIRSKRGVIKGADVVEEVLFMHENGKVAYRQDVRYDMSFIKAYNLDIYAFLSSLALITLVAVTYTLKSTFIYLRMQYRASYKIKSQ